MGCSKTNCNGQGGDVCPRGTTYQSKCKCVKWWSSWWFWRWGSCDNEEWCLAPSAPAGSKGVTKTEVKYGKISSWCLVQDCTGTVARAPACPSGYTETKLEEICGKEAGFATIRPCQASKGFYEVRTCEQTNDWTTFLLSSYNIEDRNECWPELGFAENKFPTCQSQYNYLDYYEAYYMNQAGDCLELDGGANVVPGLTHADPNLEDAPQMLSSSSTPTVSTTSVGSGAGLMVAPAAVVGLLFARRRGGMRKRRKEDEKKLTEDEQL